MPMIAGTRSAAKDLKSQEGMESEVQYLFE